MSTLPELDKHGIYGTRVFKQKDVKWLKGSDVKNVLRHMQDKDVGYLIVYKASNTDYLNANLWLALMAVSKHTSIMVNS